MISEALRQATTAHQDGRMEEAMRAYRVALLESPNAFDALHLLGIARLQLGAPVDAACLIRRANAVNRGFAAAHANLGVSLAALGLPAAALASHAQAVALDPSFTAAHEGRADALRALGRAAEALGAYRTALAIDPGRLGSLWHAAHALRAMEKPEAALVTLDRALAIQPKHPDLLGNRGVLLLELQRAEAALATFDEALARRGVDADMLANRSAALQQLRRWTPALAASAAALCLAPSHAEALNNRGNALKETGRAAAALACYGRALAVRPFYEEALRNRALLLRTLGRHHAAILDLTALIRAHPYSPYAAGYLASSRLHCCDWSDFAVSAGGLAEAVRAGRRVASPFSFFSIATSESDQDICARTFCRDAYPTRDPIWRGERYTHARLRIAYLSADFRDHAISHLLTGMFEKHDRERFETVALSFGPSDGGAMRQRLERGFSRFLDVTNLSDFEIARTIRDLEIDIAVDLMGHTHGARLGIFAHRPAPASVNFFCPTGADFIDYLIGDPVAIPPEHHRFHREKIATLPDSLLATDDRRPIAGQTPSRRELGLPESGFVFCSFNNSYKLNPPLFDIWMRLLGRIDGSVLWLQDVNEAATVNLRREAAQRGIDPARLVFAPRLPRLDEHLARYRQADLFLDTLPFNAQTTAADALWAGLPVLTCLGETFVGRIAASLLTAVGLPELVTHSLGDYERRATELARGEDLQSLRAKLARNLGTHPAFDTDRYRRHVESAYTTIADRSRRGLPPESFAVAPIA